MKAYTEGSVVVTEQSVNPTHQNVISLFSLPIQSVGEGTKEQSPIPILLLRISRILLSVRNVYPDALLCLFTFGHKSLIILILACIVIYHLKDIVNMIMLWMLVNPSAGDAVGACNFTSSQ